MDSGVSPTLANERKLANFVNPVDLLARIGADKTNVKKVFITHLHWDHLGGIELFLQAFPEAVFYVQERNLISGSKIQLARGHLLKKCPMLPPKGFLLNLKEHHVCNGFRETRRLSPAWNSTYTRAYNRAPISSGEHWKGTAIVASDCAHVQESFVTDITSCLITDMIVWMESFKKLRAKASSIDLIFRDTT